MLKKHILTATTIGIAILFFVAGIYAAAPDVIKMQKTMNTKRPLSILITRNMPKRMPKNTRTYTKMAVATAITMKTTNP